MKNLLLVLLLNLTSNFTSSAVNAAIITLQKDSKLIIHGSTNLLNFTLVQTGDEIQDKPVSVILSEHDNKYFVNQNKLTLKVNNFDSTNPIAESEFYKMMQTDKYPYLKIHLHHFEKVEDLKNNIQTNATVSFTITGITKSYVIPVKTKITENKLYIEGKKKMSIRDFGIEPPVALLGLVKVNEWIEIDFNLICEYRID